LAAKGITDSESLQNYLLENLGVAVLGGHHLGDQPGGLRFRGATSMIYGADDAQRWAALGAPDPVALPHVARSLFLLDEAFQALVG
jgi:aspartate aminotransferase